MRGFLIKSHTDGVRLATGHGAPWGVRFIYRIHTSCKMLLLGKHERCVNISTFMHGCHCACHVALMFQVISASWIQNNRSSPRATAWVMVTTSSFRSLLCAALLMVLGIRICTGTPPDTLQVQLQVICERCRMHMPLLGILELCSLTLHNAFVPQYVPACHDYPPFPEGISAN